MAKKSTNKAPSTSVTDKNVSGDSRATKTKKENKTMNSIFKALFGVIYLILKISFIIAGVALIKMPLVNIFIDIPVYQVVGSIILAFLAYLELYSYFVQPVDKKTKKNQPKTALDKFKLGYEDLA